MTLSVIVSTLNNRERLLASLDALSERVPPETEVVVVNGPSSDGTSGAVREREDVDVLVEISERNRNVSRNAGIEIATGDVVAFLGDEYVVEPSWYDGLKSAVDDGATVVTGPVTDGDRAEEPTRSAPDDDRSVVPVDGDNIAFDRTVLEALDGFDEALETGGGRDCAHRLAGLGFEVTWTGEMAVRHEVGTDGGREEADWGQAYRSLAYRLAKNYGPRPAVVGRTGGSALIDGFATARAVAAGDATPSGWLRSGTDVVRNVSGGLAEGLRARYADRTARRNPNGVSTRHDRAVQVYDRR